MYHSGVPLVNVLPPQGRLGVFQQRERQPLLVRGALALVLAVGAFTAWNLYGNSQENEQSLHEVTANLARVKSDLKRVTELERAINGVAQQKQGLQRDWEELTTQTSGLVPALQEVFRSRSTEVTLRSVNASRDGRISIQGETSYVPVLLTWQERLAASIANLRMMSLKLGESADDIIFTFTSNVEIAK